MYSLLKYFVRNDKNNDDQSIKLCQLYRLTNRVLHGSSYNHSCIIGSPALVRGCFIHMRRKSRIFTYCYLNFLPMASVKHVYVKEKCQSNM